MNQFCTSAARQLHYIHLVTTTTFKNLYQELPSKWERRTLHFMGSQALVFGSLALQEKLLFPEEEGIMDLS